MLVEGQPLGAVTQPPLGPSFQKLPGPDSRGAQAGVRGRACLSRLPVMAEGLTLGGGHAPHTPVPGTHAAPGHEIGSLQPHRLEATWGH